ncbi:hypothetical protein LJB77_01500 [Ruminococcaceae bacterium OttesenSCG-928-N02]|nr:hypothetical protein [Ruminococcaceae bacterium OttesenSCG-928-N02]
MPQNSHLYISQEDYPGNDVASAPDDLTGTPAQNKAVFDRLAKNIIAPKHNLVVEQLTTLRDETYTKTQTDERIEEKMTAIGAGDMRAAQYDPKGTIAAGGGIRAEIEAYALENGVHTYNHTFTSGTHTLTGVPGATNIKFFASAPYTQGDTFTVNGAVCNPKTTDGEPLASGYFATSAVVQCFLAGNTLNFKVGGTALNYKVVAVAAKANLPTTASENTIAVISADTITGHIVSAAAPSGNAHPGTIWVKTDQTNKSYTLNALCGQTAAIYVDPVGVLRWDGNMWRALEGYIYLSGVWVPLQSELYVAGTFRPDLVLADVTRNSGTANYTPTGVVCTVRLGSSDDAYVYTVNKVDLTNVRTIRALGTFSSWGGLFVLNPAYSAPPINTLGSAAPNATVAFTRGSGTLDVSALTGAYQIGFGLYGPNEAAQTTITRWWAE